MSTETIAAIPAPTMDPQPAQRLDSSSQRAAADAAPRSRTVEAEQSTRRADAARADEAGPEDREPRIIGPASPDARFAAMTERSPRTPQEAAVLLREAEAMYLDALARYAHLAGSEEDAGDPLARLAALEGIVLTTREALGRAPADPIINGYHMTALAQREATLQQIAATTRNPWF